MREAKILKPIKQMRKFKKIAELGCGHESRKGRELGIEAHPLTSGPTRGHKLRAFRDQISNTNVRKSRE